MRRHLLLVLLVALSVCLGACTSDTNYRLEAKGEFHAGFEFKAGPAGQELTLRQMRIDGQAMAILQYPEKPIWQFILAPDAVLVRTDEAGAGTEVRAGQFGVLYADRDLVIVRPVPKR